MARMVKNPPVNAGDVRDVSVIPGSERCPGGQDGSQLQYSCLETPMDRGAIKVIHAYMSVYVYVYIFFQIPLCDRLFRDFKYGSLRYMIGPYCLYILFREVFIC